MKNAHNLFFSEKRLAYNNPEKRRPTLKNTLQGTSKLSPMKEKLANRKVNKTILTTIKKSRRRIEKKFRKGELVNYVKKRAEKKLRAKYKGTYDLFKGKNEKIIAKTVKIFQKRKMTLPDIGDLKLSSVDNFSKAVQKFAGYTLPLDSSSEVGTGKAKKISGIDTRQIAPHMNLISKMNGKVPVPKLIKITQNSNKLMDKAVGQAIYKSYNRGSDNLLDKAVDKQIDKLTPNS